MKIGTEKRGIRFVVWYGISSTVLDYLLGESSTHTATYIAKCISLVPSAHRAIGKNIEIFSGKKLRHFIQKQNI